MQEYRKFRAQRRNERRLAENCYFVADLADSCASIVKLESGVLERNLGGTVNGECSCEGHGTARACSSTPRSPRSQSVRPDMDTTGPTRASTNPLYLAFSLLPDKERQKTLKNKSKTNVDLGSIHEHIVDLPNIGDTTKLRFEEIVPVPERPMSYDELIGE